MASLSAFLAWHPVVFYLSFKIQFKHYQCAETIPRSPQSCLGIPPPLENTALSIKYGGHLIIGLPITVDRELLLGKNGIW